MVRDETESRVNTVEMFIVASSFFISSLFGRFRVPSEAGFTVSRRESAQRWTLYRCLRKFHTKNSS